VTAPVRFSKSGLQNALAMVDSWMLEGPTARLLLPECEAKKHKKWGGV